MRLIPAITVAMGLWSGSTWGQGIRVSKTDFPRFVGVLACHGAEPQCPAALQGFSRHGLTGDFGFEDPSVQPKDSLTGRSPIALGFPDGKAFDWNKYSLVSPLNRNRIVVLNELTSSESNHALLSEWKESKGELELVRIWPQVFDIALGEAFFEGKPILQGKGFVAVLRGLGSDAGINQQEFHVLRFEPKSDVITLVSEVNRSEIPVSQIMARLNEHGAGAVAAEEVTDSTLYCALAKGGKVLRCTKTLTRLRYTTTGVEENPIGKQDYNVDFKKTSAR